MTWVRWGCWHRCADLCEQLRQGRCTPDTCTSPWFSVRSSPTTSPPSCHSPWKILSSKNKTEINVRYFECHLICKVLTQTLLLISFDTCPYDKFLNGSFWKSRQWCCTVPVYGFRSDGNLNANGLRSMNVSLNTTVSILVKPSPCHTQFCIPHWKKQCLRLQTKTDNNFEHKNM